MEINPANLQIEVDRFKKGIKKRNPNEFSRLSSVKELDSIRAAIELAYIDTRRTMRGISKPENKDYQEIKEKVLENIEIELYDYFNNQDFPKNFNFSTEHEKLCNIWHNKFNRIKKDIKAENKKDSNSNDEYGKTFGTYGKAQKIINMAFKYLYCCSDAPGCKRDSKYKDHFKYCHMPLDRYTLTWFARDVEKKESKKRKVNVNEEYSWSNIDNYEEYDSIQKDINDFINSKIDKETYTLSPLELEFLVWPESQRHLAAEGFLFGLKDYEKKEKEKVKTKMPLDEKYREIIKFLNDNGYK